MSFLCWRTESWTQYLRWILCPYSKEWSTGGESPVSACCSHVFWCSPWQGWLSGCIVHFLLSLPLIQSPGLNVCLWPEQMRLGSCTLCFSLVSSTKIQFRISETAFWCKVKHSKWVLGQNSELHCRWKHKCEHLWLALLCIFFAQEKLRLRQKLGNVTHYSYFGKVIKF